MNKKGFITIYGILLLNLSLNFSLLLIQKVKTYYHYHNDNTLDFVEIQAINKVKNDLLEYEEENESYTFLSYQVELSYEDIICDIKIFKNEKLLMQSRLEYDDVENEVVSYTYLK